MSGSSLRLVFPPTGGGDARLERAAMFRIMPVHRSPIADECSRTHYLEQLLRRIARERIPVRLEQSRVAAKLRGSIKRCSNNWPLRRRRWGHAPLRHLLERVGEREQPWLAAGAAREAHSEG